MRLLPSLSARTRVVAALKVVRAAVLATPQPDLAAEIATDHLRETVALLVLGALLGAAFWLLP